MNKTIEYFKTYGAICTLALAVLFTASCDALLDVENPNSLTEEDVNAPTSAEGLKNGALNALMVGTAWTYASTSTVSDELFWTGSYEAYESLSEGQIAFDGNEILVEGFPQISQARYMADFAIERLEGFRDDDPEGIFDATILAQTYIYGALGRITIADAYDDFVFSDGVETSPAIGEDNMSDLYDQAITMLDDALVIAQDEGNETLEMQALGVRARAKHAKGVWELLNPSGSTPGDPLVSSTGATADAEEALELMGDDYTAEFNYNSPQVTNYMAGQVNGRGEITFNDPFDDLKTGDTDPRAAAAQEDFNDTDAYTENYSPFTWISSREMRLIIAEEAIGTDDDEARDQMNAVRELDDLPDIEPGDDLVEYLEHERRANLFLQGRRLNDMYRFGTQSSDWTSSSDAVETPGVLLPIPSNEQLANPDL